MPTAPSPSLPQLLMLGESSLGAGRPQDAEFAYGQALVLAPRSLEALRGRGYALMQLNRLADAMDSLQLALQTAPADLMSHQLFGRLCLRLQQPELAIKHFGRVQKKIPASEAARSGLCDAYLALGDSEQATKMVRQMLAIDPRSTVGLLSAARLAEYLGDLDAADAHYAKLAQLMPDSTVVRYEHGMLALKRGRFAEGWAGYEARFACGVSLGLRPTSAQWAGESTRHLLVVAEQGLGDAIQFSRFLALARLRCERLTLAVHPPLMPLLAQLDGVALVSLADNRSWPAHDVHCMLMSLPQALALGEHTLDMRTSWLTAEPERVASWRARLGSTARPRIGLAALTSIAHVTESLPYTRRACPVDELVRHAGDACTLVSLQPDTRHANIIDTHDALHDFADTAALVAALDVVITVDTAVAHLAGALGKPTLLLLPVCPTWRWMSDTDTSSWYPSIRVFRQSLPGSWDEPVQRAFAALDQLLSQEDLPR